eukprot:s4654_g1.t1
MIDLFANSTACVLPEQLRYINITYQGQCMLFEVPIPTTGADLHSMLTAAFFPDAAGATPALRLTDAESGHVISDGPEHVHTSSSHIIHCEVSRPDGQYEEPVNLRYRDMFLCFLVRADWRQVERDLGLMSTLFEAPPAEWPNCFKFAAATYDPECTAVAFVTPALLKATMDALCKLSFVKLCGDGTYHLTHESWALLSIGALTKHYVRDGSSYAFRTTFSPLMFANKESDENYDLLFKATVDCAKQVSGVDLAQAMC